MTKPFDNIFDLVKKMELLAQTGRRRRLYRLEEEPRGMDPSRLRRPVFLSYSTNDQRVATGIRRNLEAKDIGVWYAPTALRVGDAWTQSVENGIDQATVFAALITNDYLRSPFCIGELVRFHRRVESDVKQQLVMLPILAGPSEDARKHEVLGPLLGTWQYVDISVRFIDGLTALLGRIQRSVPQKSKYVIVNLLKVGYKGVLNERFREAQSRLFTIRRRRRVGQMEANVDLSAIQTALREQQLDGWLFYDHHHRDPIAYRVLKITPAMCTRRWYYLVPATGEPVKLVHRIEKYNLDGLPGAAQEYSSWIEQRDKLKAILAGKKRVAMEYSALNDIPYVGLVDAGTVELVTGFGVDVVSSADLVQLFEASWSPEALASHLRAGSGVHAAVRGGFAMIRHAVSSGKAIGEYDVQQEIARLLDAQDIEADEPPVVAVNANSSNPHYSPTRATSKPIHKGDFILLDVWGKCRSPGSVYFDITWTGFVGDTVPDRYTNIFNIVREARDAAVILVRDAAQESKAIYGYQVDDAARGVISSHGYGEYFVHRTGHSIGEDVHGNGANMDNFETRDNRRIIPRTCFSVEPGIYLQEFGVRSEVDVYVDEHEARVTGEMQQAVVPILSGP